MSSHLWVKLSKTALPPLHQGVLIRTIGVGPVYDVACYTGKDASGADRWIMADITLDAKAITHWAVIIDPEDAATADDLELVESLGRARNGELR